VRGLMLIVTSSDQRTPVNQLAPRINMVSGRRSDTVRIGLLDLDGGERLKAGEAAVLKLPGHAAIKSGVVSDANHNVVAVQVNAERIALPATFALHQNYPNPFNPNTRIDFDLPKACEVELIVYNILGQKVVTLVDRELDPGFHHIDWDGSRDDGGQVASGVYFYRLRAGDFVESKKMMMLK